MKSLLEPKVLIPSVAVLGVVLLVAYIFLAPPTMWKPVYIRFEDSSAEAQGPPATHAAQPSPVPQGLVIPYKPGEGIMYDLGSKIVNLAEPGGRRYLQIGIVLECLPSDSNFFSLTGEARKKAQEHEVQEIDALRPVMEDAAIGLLTSRTYAEIFTIEGKEQLKQALLSEINGILGREKVAAVYFTEFLVQ